VRGFPVALGGEFRAASMFLLGVGCLWGGDDAPSLLVGHCVNKLGAFKVDGQTDVVLIISECS
jgi:hypothetical protein